MEIKNVFTKKNPQKIIFKDALLEYTLGQWLGVSRDTVMTEATGMEFIYSRLDGKKLLGSPIPKDQKEEIQKKAQEMFDAFGFQNESIVLKNFVSDKNEFEVFVKDKKETYKACLRFGGLDFGPELILSSDYFKKVCNYIPSDNCYFFFYYELMNREKGNQVSRYASLRDYSVQFENQSYQGSISFNYPEYISYSSMSDGNPYVDDKELNEFLINLDYPVSMIDVYEKLLTVIHIPREKLNIEISIFNKEKNLFYEGISTQKGVIQSMTVTRNRRIMSWNENDNSWSLKSGDFRVEKRGGKYSYSSGNHTEKDVMYSLSKEDEIEMVEQEVLETKEEVKKRLLIK